MYKYRLLTYINSRPSSVHIGCTAAYTLFALTYCESLMVCYRYCIASPCSINCINFVFIKFMMIIQHVNTTGAAMACFRFRDLFVYVVDRL
jgi:hypothetical protein